MQWFRAVRALMLLMLQERPHHKASATMLNMTTTANCTSFALGISAQHGQSNDLSCSAMTIAWRTRGAEPFPQQSGPGIQILIPGEQTACHIVYANADGREQRVFVRGPQVAIIPADQPYTLECEPRRDMLVITLDPMFFEMKAHEALGGEPSAPMRRCAAVDPFIRELGNTLKRELEMSRMPPA